MPSRSDSIAATQTSGDCSAYGTLASCKIASEFACLLPSITQIRAPEVPKSNPSPHPAAAAAAILAGKKPERAERAKQVSKVSARAYKGGLARSMPPTELNAAPRVRT